MSYSRNFGFRSFENIVRNGRFRAPATGTPILIGAPVIIDTATPGYLKPATAGAALGLGGIALFEHIQKKGVDLDLVGTADFASVPLGQYTQIVHGPGTKVWFKNASFRPPLWCPPRASQSVTASRRTARASSRRPPWVPTPCGSSSSRSTPRPVWSRPGSLSERG
jgi:hypothetical protein